MSALHHLREVEDSRSEVCRTSQTAGEWQCNGMCRGIAALCIPGIILLSTHTLLCHQVGPCTLDTCRHSGLMIINHDVMLGCTLDDAAIVADAILRLGQLFAIKKVAHITSLDGTDA